MTVCENYLDGARDAGLLACFGRFAYVAGAYQEPVSGEHQYLVTYWDPALARRDTWWSELPAAARAADPLAQAVVLRAPAEVRLSPPWHRYITYLRYDAAVAPPGAFADGPAVREATSGEDGLIRRWLAMALATAAEAQGAPGGRPVPQDVVDALFGTPGRHSFVALRGGVPVGHATVLCDEEDEVTGRRTAELFDILVEADAGERRRATAALVAASARHAARLGLPLMGNVVHTLAGASDPGERVVSSLTAQGWRPDHVLWRRPLAGEGAAR
ncbi:MAG TPA: hypothetical protein VIU15_01960 [Streptomyces sp.]